MHPTQLVILQPSEFVDAAEPERPLKFDVTIKSYNATASLNYVNDLANAI